MATIEQDKNELERLKKILSEFSNMKPESFSRRDELGVELCFEEGIPYFSRTLDLFNELNSYSLEGVPFNTLRSLADDANTTHEDFQKIIDFSLDKHPDNTLRVRDQLINTIRDKYDNSYKLITPTITYLAGKKTDFGDIKEDATNNAKEIERLKSELEKKLNEIEEESNSILESIRDAAAEKGVSQHAIYFKEEADSHEAPATKWLWFTIITGIITLVTSYLAYFYFYTNLNLTTGQSIQLAISKLIVLSVLYFAII